jgi:hydrogenase/urease accessory protein HupE
MSCPRHRFELTLILKIFKQLLMMNLINWKITRIWRIAIALMIGLLLSLNLALPSQAHWADLAVAEIQIKERDVDLNLTLPTGLVTQFDDDLNRQLSDVEITKHSPEIQKFLDQKIRLTAGAQKTGTLMVRSGVAKNLPTNLNATPDTHSNLLLQYHWSQPLEQLQIHYDLFAPGVTTARCLAQLVRAGKVDNLVFTPASKDAALINLPVWQQMTSFTGLGIEHILTGYDHILFLVSLLMLGGGLKYLIKIVTAFTLAHSVTLSLAVLNIVTLPSRWVECAIALSIAYIATENLWRRESTGRWKLAFGFGLIHGLGFASALQELDLPRTNLAISLASFNIGVELGQISIVLIIYFLLSYLRKSPWDLTIRRAISVGVIGMSLIWFWERAF